MGFSVTDLTDEQNFLFVNFWNWHPTVELIRSFGVIDDERLELMQIQCVGAQISRHEARHIGERIQKGILSHLSDEGRVKLDLSVTTEPDDGTMYYGDDAERNYGANRTWLRKFAHFCLTCSGFEVA